MRAVEYWPEWTPSVRKVIRLDVGPLRKGSRARIHQPKLLPAVWQVTEMDDTARTFTWVTRGLGVHVTGSHSVDALERGSRATLSLVFAGFAAGLVAWLTRDLNHRYLAFEAQGLKNRCEAKAAGHMAP